MQVLRHVDSLEEREVLGEGIQLAKQFLNNIVRHRGAIEVRMKDREGKKTTR